MNNSTRVFVSGTTLGSDILSNRALNGDNEYNNTAHDQVGSPLISLGCCNIFDSDLTNERTPSLLQQMSTTIPSKTTVAEVKNNNNLPSSTYSSPRSFRLNPRRSLSKLLPSLLSSSTIITDSFPLHDNTLIDNNDDANKEESSTIQNDRKQQLLFSKTSSIGGLHHYGIRGEKRTLNHIEHRMTQTISCSTDEAIFSAVCESSGRVKSDLGRTIDAMDNHSTHSLSCHEQQQQQQHTQFSPSLLPDNSMNLQDPYQSPVASGTDGIMMDLASMTFKSLSFNSYDENKDTKNKPYHLKTNLINMNNRNEVFSENLLLSSPMLHQHSPSRLNCDDVCLEQKSLDYIENSNNDRINCCLSPNVGDTSMSPSLQWSKQSNYGSNGESSTSSQQSRTYNHTISHSTREYDECDTNHQSTDDVLNSTLDVKLPITADLNNPLTTTRNTEVYSKEASSISNRNKSPTLKKNIYKTSVTDPFIKCQENSVTCFSSDQSLPLLSYEDNTDEFLLVAPISMMSSRSKTLSYNPQHQSCTKQLIVNQIYKEHAINHDDSNNDDDNPKKSKSQRKRTKRK